MEILTYFPGDLLHHCAAVFQRSADVKFQEQFRGAHNNFENKFLKE